MSVAIESTRPASAAGGTTDVAALRRLLAAVRRQTRGWIWIESLAWLGLVAAGFFWASLILDRAVEPPRWLRASVLAAAVLAVIVLAYRKLVKRLARPLDDASLAVVVERSHPAFRDSLSTAIELAGRTGAETNPDLLARTAAEAVATLGLVRPRRIFRCRPLTLLAFAAVAAVASVAVLAVCQPAVASLWVRRVPLLGDEPWPRRVRLTVADFTDGVRKVARGSDVEVIVHAASTDRPPELVDLRWRQSRGNTDAAAGVGGRTWRTERMGTRGGATENGQAFGHVLKAVGESLDLEIRGGDARLRNLRLQVLEPPALERLAIAWDPPEYIGRGRREAAPARVVQIPRGSNVEIACTSTKPLAAATIVAVPVGTAAAGGDPAAEQVLATFAADGPMPRSITGRIESLAADQAIVVRFTDTDGLANREPVTFVLAAVPDEPPQVSLRLHGISTAITPKARVPLVGAIADDHGLGSASVRVRVLEGDERTLALPRIRPGDSVVEWTVESPEVVAIEPFAVAAGRKLELTVSAVDTCTLGAGPNVGASDAWTLDVVTPDVLMAMLEAREIILRRRFESCVADLAQARDAFAVPARGSGDEAEDERAAGTAGLGEAASRAAGETGEIAGAFRAIRLEFDNNQLITPELEARLIAQIAEPLAAVAASDLPGVVAACRSGEDRGRIVRRVDDALERMRAVLGKMLELESFNEVVEILRGMIRAQEQIRSETLEQQKKRAREALERP